MSPAQQNLFLDNSSVNKLTYCFTSKNVVVVGQRFSLNQYVYEDGEQNHRNKAGPAELPVPAGLAAQHEFDITTEVVDAVDPVHADHFQEGEDEDHEALEKKKLNWIKKIK